MLSLTGILINTFKTDGGVNKEGETYSGQDKIQLLGDVENPNGSVKKDMYTLTVKNPAEFVKFINQKIVVPIGVFASGKQLTYFVSKGGTPSLADPI